MTREIFETERCLIKRVPFYCGTGGRPLSRPVNISISATIVNSARVRHGQTARGFLPWNNFSTPDGVNVSSGRFERSPETIVLSPNRRFGEQD